MFFFRGSIEELLKKLEFLRSLDFFDIPAEASSNSLVDWVNRW